jgi:hypothetical protein
MKRMVSWFASIAVAISLALSTGCSATPTEPTSSTRQIRPNSSAPAADGTDTTCKSGFTVPGGHAC